MNDSTIRCCQASRPKRLLVYVPRTTVFNFVPGFDALDEVFEKLVDRRHIRFEVRLFGPNGAPSLYLGRDAETSLR